jgi:hypothetical protein
VVDIIFKGVVVVLVVVVVVDFDDGRFVGITF